MNVVSFLIQSVDRAGRDFNLVPAVDSISLINKVAEYERSREWKPAGAYGGLTATSCRIDLLGLYFLGQLDPTWLSDNRKIALLSCSCGEVGCWPLLSEIREESGQIIWRHFEQPHRDEWDYAAFGPFRFDAHQYRQALDSLQKQLSL